MSLFIDEFKEVVNSHKVEFINEMKDRVTVLHIENLTKPLYQVFPKRLYFNFLSQSFANNLNSKYLTFNCLQ